jgi:N utilization substance protein B
MPYFFCSNLVFLGITKQNDSSKSNHNGGLCMSRRLDRETILQCLFQIDLGGVAASEAIQNVMEEKPEDTDQEFIHRIVQGTSDHQQKIDSIISQYSIGWQLERMPNVDLNVLRMAVFELVYEREAPERVVINEAIELAKAFSTAESGKFVNGVLGKMLGDLEQLRDSDHQ